AAPGDGAERTSRVAFALSQLRHLQGFDLSLSYHPRAADSTKIAPHARAKIMDEMRARLWYNEDNSTILSAPRGKGAEDETIRPSHRRGRAVRRSGRAAGARARPALPGRRAARSRRGQCLHAGGRGHPGAPLRRAYLPYV